MSRRYSGPPKSRRHIEVYDEDWFWLKSRYGEVGIGRATREIIHKRVAFLRQREIDRQETQASELVDAQ